jgi:hypothetical protein
VKENEKFSARPIQDPVRGDHGDVNGDSEIAAYRRAFEELERFGGVLAEIEREEAADLEELLELEYGGDDAVLYALGEEDRAWTEIPAMSWPRP